VTEKYIGAHDPKLEQITNHLRLHRIDSGVRQSLNPQSIQSISKSIAEEEAKTKQPSALYKPKKNPNIEPSQDTTYTENNNIKYSWNRAAEKLAQSNIRLRSTHEHYDEI
jgi:hypothetical protein